MRARESYEQPFHKFIMRACEVNSDIGNETIGKYLKLSNSEMCAKIVTEIILSSDLCLVERVQLVHQFILDNLSAPPADLEPYLERFCQLVFILEQRKNTPTIRLTFQKDSIGPVVERLSKSEIFAKYLCQILTMKGPFEQEGLDRSATYSLLKSNDGFNEIIEALVISDKEARQWFMQNNRLESLNERILKLIEKKDDVQGL